MTFLLSIITWISGKTKLPVIAIQLILLGLLGLGLFISYNAWVNSIRDKAVQQYKMEEAKKISKEVERQVEEGRKALVEKEKALEQRELALAKDSSELQKSRREFREEAVAKLTAIDEKEEALNEAIKTAVRNIPDDELDSSIRSFIAKYKKSAPTVNTR